MSLRQVMQKNLLAIQTLKVVCDCILPILVSFVVFGINIVYISVCLIFIHRIAFECILIALKGDFSTIMSLYK